MALSNPFIVLSYVGGPALLTNATSLFIMSTSNRFGRAIDRSRFLSEKLSGSNADPLRAIYLQEMPDVHRRVLLIGRAMVCFYLAVGSFALATLGSILGAVLAESAENAATYGVVFIAISTGLIGFAAFIAGAWMLVMESRMAVRSLSREYTEAIRLAQQGT